jgi:hypothetical protein
MARKTPPTRTTRAGNGSRRASAESDDPRDQPIPVHDDGAPIWSANSRNTAEENAERSFKRNGEDFGAKNVDQYVDMAHAFIGNPPKGTLRLSRDNGDKLFYDPKGNVFAVATRDGAPAHHVQARRGHELLEEAGAAARRPQRRRPRLVRQQRRQRSPQRAAAAAAAATAAPAAPR